MAILPVKDDKLIPKDATLWLSRREAIDRQTEIIGAWEPVSEVWPFKYGRAILSVGAITCGLSLNVLFRHKLKLHQKGAFFTAICFSTAPAGITSILHDRFISKPISIYDKQCPTCFELKAILIQTFAAIIFPIFLAPCINISFAAGMGLRVPQIIEIKELGKFFWNTVQPASTHIAIMFGVNSILAAFITQQEIKAMENVGNILLEVERKSLNDQDEEFLTVG